MVKSGLVLACVALAQWVSAQQAPQMEALPIDPNVRYGVLDNGLTYYVRHNETPKNRAEFHIAQKVGSILENEDQRGLAHFLEHMAFNGTEHFPGKNMLNYLENKGIKFGVDINAYTGFDETVYRISNVPTQNQNLVDSCLLVLYDWACAISLNDKDIDEERGVIHEEWRTRADANWRTWEVTVPVMFAGSQYANRMPIGTMEVVMNFPYQALRDYYHKWYRPDQQGIIVIGDFDADKMEAQIKELFGKIKMPENAAERIYYTVPDNKEPIFAFHKDKEATYTRVDIYMKHDPMPREMRGTINGAINDYMGQVVGIMFNDRISEITQKPDAPFIAGAIFDGDFFVSKTKDAFTLIALGKDNGAIDAIKGIMREAERIDRFGFTASEYDRARATLLSRYENMYKERNNHKNIDYAEEYIRHFIDGGYIPGIEMEYNLLKQISPAITVDMVNQYIKTLISEDNMVISLTGPDKEGVSYPDKDQVLAAIKEVEAEEITPYVDNVSNEPLISDEPVAGKIVKSAAGKKFGTTESTRFPFVPFPNFFSCFLIEGIEVFIPCSEYHEIVVNEGFGFYVAFYAVVTPNDSSRFNVDCAKFVVAASDVGDSVSYGNCSQYGCFGVYFPQQSAVGCIQTVYIHVGRAEYDDVFIGGRCPYDTHIRFETPLFSAVGGRITGNGPGVIAYVNFFIPIGR